jgi:hypothetical protein
LQSIRATISGDAFRDRQIQTSEKAFKALKVIPEGRASALTAASLKGWRALTTALGNQCNECPLWSGTDILRTSTDVCFTPQSGH